MLETARALASGEPLRNDIVMIFTDGEEAGLLGASSFVAEHPRGAKGGVVLNWEATGNAGPSVLFETSSGMRS
jgi:Zn-dependent M28 family amino/carboxypeptidase